VPGRTEVIVPSISIALSEFIIGNKQMLIGAFRIEGANRIEKTKID